MLIPTKAVSEKLKLQRECGDEAGGGSVLLFSSSRLLASLSICTRNFEITVLLPPAGRENVHTVHKMRHIFFVI